MYNTKEETGPYTPEDTPYGIKAASMTLSVFTITLTAVCIDRFIRSVRAWKELPVAQWVLLLFYCLSFLFSSVSAILKNLEPNTSRTLCDASILVCLLFYLSAKILQYHYLVERAVSLTTPVAILNSLALTPRSILFVPTALREAKTRFIYATAFFSLFRTLH